VSGWEINRDGSVEFNIGVFRGTITGSSFVTGTPGGQRIEINTDDSNEIDFYDEDDNLIMTLGSTPGTIMIYDPSGDKDPIGISEGTITWYERGGILTPDVSMYTIDGITYLNTQLAGGVAFDSTAGASLKYVQPGSDTLETWHNPTYSSTQWMGSTTFNGGTNWGTLQLRRTANDTVEFSGAFKTATTGAAPSATVLNVPVGFRPTRQEPIWVQRFLHPTATLTAGFAMVTPAGNLNLPTPTGLGAALDNEYLIAGSIPLHS
jgi:hypothetical protein